jgi:hypothetical protein
VYPLDHSITLRGILKLDANNKLYADGDTYKSDGSHHMKMAEVDLGTLTWVDADSNGRTRTNEAVAVSLPAESASVIPNIRSSKYVAITPSEWYNSAKEGISMTCLGLGVQERIAITSSAFAGKTGAEIKTLLSGVYADFESNSPTDSTADPFTSPQIVNDFGTETLTDYLYETNARDVEIPVGHVTRYPHNQRMKLDRIPDPPTVAGNYKLNVTVTGGKPVYSWVSG